MRKCKHLLCIILFSCYFLMMTVSAYAKGPPEIYSPPDKITFNDSKITIPIFIRDNPGLMGIKLRIDYPSDAFSFPKITSKDLLSVGIFEDSISESTKGSFDIIWSNTENVSKDGLLFAIEFTRNAGFIGEKSIVNLNYYPDDTFDENWDSVALSCDNIVLKFDGEKAEAESVTKKSQPIISEDEITVPAITVESTSSPETNVPKSKATENSNRSKNLGQAPTNVGTQNKESSAATSEAVSTVDNEMTLTANEVTKSAEESTKIEDVIVPDNTSEALSKKADTSEKQNNKYYFAFAVIVALLISIALIIRKKVKPSHEKNA